MQEREASRRDSLVADDLHATNTVQSPDEVQPREHLAVRTSQSVVSSSKGNILAPPLNRTHAPFAHHPEDIREIQRLQQHIATLETNQFMQTSPKPSQYKNINETYFGLKWRHSHDSHFNTFWVWSTTVHNPQK